MSTFKIETGELVGLIEEETWQKTVYNYDKIITGGMKGHSPDNRTKHWWEEIVGQETYCTCSEKIANWFKEWLNSRWRRKPT